MASMSKFVVDNKISMSAEWADRNPNMADDEWAASASHFKCILRRGAHRMTIYFSQGPAITGEPTAEHVLDSVASDAAGVEDQSFEDFCGEYGYDTDSRRAEKTYNACRKSAEKLRKFLGDEELYQDLLYKTDRL